MGVLDDPFGLGGTVSTGIPDFFGLGNTEPAAPVQRTRPRARFGIYYIQNGLRRTKTFRSLEAAERFKANAKNIEGVTRVSEVFEI